MTLAADLPAAIIADLLGMHINTAIRWVDHAGRDWTDYFVARAAKQAEESGEDKLGEDEGKCSAGISPFH